MQEETGEIVVFLYKREKVMEYIVLEVNEIVGKK